MSCADRSRRNFIARGGALGLGVSLAGAGLGGRAFAQQDTAQRIEAGRLHPDIALVNGRFVDHRGMTGDAMTIADGRIAAVGTSLAIDAAAAAVTVDLGGRTVIPGFVDAHVHYTRAGVSPGYQARRIERAFSIAELQQAIAARAADVPAGRFITCIGGWNHRQLAEARRPTLAELDDAARDHAVYISGTGGGTGAITNRLGRDYFQARGIAVEAATGVVESPTAALAALQQEQAAADRLRGTRELNAHAASLGLTTVVNAGNYEDQSLPLELWREDRLAIRMRPL